MDEVSILVESANAHRLSREGERPHLGVGYATLSSRFTAAVLAAQKDRGQRPGALRRRLLKVGNNLAGQVGRQPAEFAEVEVVQINAEKAKNL